MNKEEARKMLIEATRELRQANIVLEAHRQGVEDIQEEIAKLEAIINKPDRWQDGLVQPDKEQYFYLTDSAYNSLVVDRSVGTERKPEHAFRTQEQAKLIKEKTLLMWEMYNFAHVRNEDWMVDWGNTKQVKYGIVSKGAGVKADWFTRDNEFVFGIAVKSITIAEEMLEIFGKRIEKVYNKLY